MFKNKKVCEINGLSFLTVFLIRYLIYRALLDLLLPANWYYSEALQRNCAKVPLCPSMLKLEGCNRNQSLLLSTLIFFFNYFLYSVISYIFFIGRSTWCNYFFHGVLFMELPTVHISLRAHSVIIKCQFFCYQYLFSIIISIKWLSPFWKCMLQSLDFNYDFHWRSFLSSCTWWFILRYIYLHKMHVTLQKWILKCSLQRMLALHAVFFAYVETCQICDDHWILLLICGAVKFQLMFHTFWVILTWTNCF